MTSGGKSLGIIFLVMQLTACTLTREVPLSDCDVSRADVNSKLDLRRFVEATMVDICPTKSLLSESSDAVSIVPDVVDIQSLEPGALGIALGEMMRTEVFNRCGIPIRQVEISQQVRLNLSGLTMMSRDADRALLKSIPAESAFVGAYNLERNRLRLTVRHLRLSDSVIQRITSRELKWECAKLPVGRPTFRQHID